MPEMDGIAVAKEIRKHYDKETTVIILTSFNWDEIMEEAIHSGVDSFLANLCLHPTCLMNSNGSHGKTT